MVEEELWSLLRFFLFFAIALLPHLSGFSLLRVSHPLREASDRCLNVGPRSGARFLGTGETGRFFCFGLEVFDPLAEDFFTPFRFFAMKGGPDWLGG